MKRTALVLALILTLLFQVAAGTLFFINLASANPYNFPVPSMKIISPPDPPNRYENSSVSLEIHVSMLNESPRLQSIYYSLDGAPFVYLDFTTLRIAAGTQIELAI